MHRRNNVVEMPFSIEVEFPQDLVQALARSGVPFSWFAWVFKFLLLHRLDPVEDGLPIYYGVSTYGRARAIGFDPKFLEERLEELLVSAAREVCVEKVRRRREGKVKQ